MRRDVQDIFRMTPQEKQVMMFSATLPKELRVVCKKFMQEVRPFCSPRSCNGDTGCGGIGGGGGGGGSSMGRLPGGSTGQPMATAAMTSKPLLHHTFQNHSFPLPVT